MREFDDAMTRLLMNGLIVQAHQENFHIETSGAKFFADRALVHIKSRNKDKQKIISDALEAIRVAPELLSRIRSEYDRNAIRDFDIASASVPRKDCIYPWCSK